MFMGSLANPEINPDPIVVTGAKGQLISEWALNQKMNKNISVFLPYLSKKVKWKKKNIILEEK